jgi:hypothetical protein
VKKHVVCWTCLVTILVFTFILAACRQEEPTPAAVPEEQDSTLPTPLPTEQEAFTARVTNYNLGETTIVQDHFPEDSRFRNMPVRLQGIIGMPESDRQHPVVLIMHGSHAACPGENEWPCSAEEEQKNYEGFTYLVEAMAEAGYVALSVNVNAEHTFGFGEAPPTLRTKQLIDLHLEELAAANAGDSGNFGLDLTNRVDESRMVWLGHSRGGELANRILRDQNAAFGSAFTHVQGLIQVAPSVVFADSLPVADMAIATILPACDQDLITLDGQRYYESARLDPVRQQFASSVYLEGANHNGFNSKLEPEREEFPENRPDCTSDTLLDAEDQQTFLADYAVDFLRALFGDSDQTQSAQQHLGVLTDEPVPNNLYGHPTKINFLPGQDDRLLLIQPDSDEELTRNLVDGEVRMANVTALFCPEGYYIPANEPGTEPCKRVNFNQPGYPQMFVLNWDTADSEWRTLIPESHADLRGYTALQLRAILDPLTDSNVEGEPQLFSVELVDANNKRAQVVTPDIEFPLGVRHPNEYFEGDSYTGHVFMGTQRIPLEQLEGIDLANIAEIALLFDQTETGTLFFADLALVKGD